MQTNESLAKQFARVFVTHRRVKPQTKLLKRLLKRARRRVCNEKKRKIKIKKETQLIKLI